MKSRALTVLCLAAALAGGSGTAMAAPSDRLMISYPSATQLTAQTVQSNGEEPRDLQFIEHPGAFRGPTWTADGSALVSIASRVQDYRCCYVQVSAQDGSGMRTVAMTDLADAEPIVAPDASRIGWFESGSQGYRMVLANTDGAGQTRVQLPHTHVRAPMWSPLGDRISYHVSEGNVPRLFTVRLDGTDPVLVGENTFLGEWSPRGDAFLAARSGAGRTQTVVAAADGSGDRLLVDGQAAGWSPDGTTIGVIRGADLFLIDVATGAERLLHTVSEGSSAGIIRTAWSPDGEEIALLYAYQSEDGREEGRSPAVTVSTDTGQEISRVGEPAIQFSTLAYSPQPSVARPVQSLEPACAESSEPAGYDDTAGSVHRTAIDCLSNLGVLRGTTPTTFHPGRDVTRGQIALMLHRIAATEGGQSDTSDAGFSDLDGQSEESRDAINAMANAGVVNGKSASTFAPGAPATRAQTASLLNRFHQLLDGQPHPYRGNCFYDDAGNVHEANIDALCRAGIVTGTDGRGQFTPNASLSRGQVASFLARLLAAAADEQG